MDIDEENLDPVLEHHLKECTPEERTFLIESLRKSPPLAQWQIDSIARLQAALLPRQPRCPHGVVEAETTKCRECIRRRALGSKP